MGKVSGNYNDAVVRHTQGNEGEPPKQKPDKPSKELEPGDIMDPPVARHSAQHPTLNKWWEHNKPSCSSSPTPEPNSSSSGSHGAEPPESSQAPSVTPEPTPSVTPPPAPNAWTIDEGKALRELITKSQIFNAVFTRDDLEQIANGSWDKYPGSRGTLTDAEINAAKRLVADDGALLKLLDAASDGTLNAWELYYRYSGTSS
jgi:hypothetical protein